MIRGMRYAILGGLVLVLLLALGATQDWSAQSSTRVLAIDLPVQTVAEDARPQAQQREPTARSVQAKPKPQAKAKAKAKAKPTARVRPKRIEARKPPRVTRTPARAPAASQSRGAAPVRSSPPVQIQERDDDDDADSDDAAATPQARRPAPAPRPATPQGDDDDGDGAAGGENADDGDD